MTEAVDPRAHPVRRRGEVAVIDLVGDIDAGADAGLMAAWEEATSTMPVAVALGFERVGYINSTGIALVVALLARARAVPLALRAFGLSAHYREIFEITRLADFVEIFDDEAGATGRGHDTPDEVGEEGPG